MQTLSVVEHLEVVEGFGLGLRARVEAATVWQAFGLVVGEEAIGHGVVVAVGLAAHALGDVEHADQVNEIVAGELAALVGVKAIVKSLKKAGLKSR